MYPNHIKIYALNKAGVPIHYTVHDGQMDTFNYVITCNVTKITLQIIEFKNSKYGFHSTYKEEEINQEQAIEFLKLW